MIGKSEDRRGLMELDGWLVYGFHLLKESTLIEHGTLSNHALHVLFIREIRSTTIINK